MGGIFARWPGEQLGLLAAEDRPSLRRADEAAVWLCRRQVNDWRVQLFFPGVEHYSLWLPAQKRHRGAVADFLGQPLTWIDEVYLDPRSTEGDWLQQGLVCEPVAPVDVACVSREINRQQDEGLYGPTNHCQHKVLEVLETCGANTIHIIPNTAALWY